MIEINESSIFTLEIVESKPATIEIIAPKIISIDVINQNPIVSLQLIEGTNFVANITEGINYGIFVEPQVNSVIEISEKISIKNTTTTITNNITNNIDNLSVDIPCDPSVFIGAAVYLQIVGSTVTAYNAQANDIATSNVFGICELKPSSTTAKVRFGGKTLDIFTNLDLSKEYYLSDSQPGMMVVEDNIPTAPGSNIVKLGQPFSPSSLLYLRGGKAVVVQLVASSDLTSFGFSGDIAIDTGIRTNTEDIIDYGLRFV